MTLLELAERCEAAAGYDRELDLLIFEMRYREKYGREVNYDPGERGGKSLRDSGMYDAGGSWEKVPSVTASLDAAMTLVPEGWDGPEIDLQTRRGKTWAKVTTFREGLCPMGEGRGATAALALCAAALRARAALQDQQP